MNKLEDFLKYFEIVIKKQNEQDNVEELKLETNDEILIDIIVKLVKGDTKIIEEKR